MEIIIGILAAAVFVLMIMVFSQKEEIKDIKHNVKTLVDGNEIHATAMAEKLIDISNKIDEVGKKSVDTYNKADSSLDAGKRQIAVCWAALQNFHMRMMRVETRVGKIYEKSVAKATEEDNETAEELGADIERLLETYPMPTEEQINEAAAELQRGLDEDESIHEVIS